MDAVKKQPIAIIHDNKPMASLICANAYEDMITAIEETKLYDLIIEG